MPTAIFEPNQTAALPAQLCNATPLKAVMQDHDSLWKKAIDAFLFECIAFCWPTAFALVDCSVTPIFLEQELAPASGARRRRVDKLEVT